VILWGAVKRAIRQIVTESPVANSQGRTCMCALHSLMGGHGGPPLQSGLSHAFLVDEINRYPDSICNDYHDNNFGSEEQATLDRDDWKDGE
jgi:hypothetical protein